MPRRTPARTNVVCARDGCSKRCTPEAVAGESPPYCSRQCFAYVRGAIADRPCARPDCPEVIPFDTTAARIYCSSACLNAMKDKLGRSLRVDDDGRVSSSGSSDDDDEREPTEAELVGAS